jgi:hypothetical protein
MPDQLQSIVQRMIDANESEENIATVIQHFKTQPPADPNAHVSMQDLASQGPSAMRATAGEGFKATAKFAGEHPGTMGAAIAGAAAAPFTGGTSIPAAMAIEGAIGAGGALAGHAVKGAVTGTMPDAKDAFSDAAMQGALGMAGPAAGGALKIVGNGLYRAAALPINKLAKYGNLVEKGLENAVPVSKGGLRQAEGLAVDARNAKAAALADADSKVALRMKSITADSGSNLSRQSERIADTGAPTQQDGWDQQLAAMEKRNPYLTPSKADEIKGTFDNQTGGAYKKMRMKEPLTPSEQFDVENGQALSRGLSDVVPNYKDLNRAKMDAEGLRQMIDRRTGNGSGANQGLENALTMLGGLSAVPARLAMLPPVLSRAAIATYKTGKGVAEYGSNALRAALLEALAGNEGQ